MQKKVNPEALAGAFSGLVAVPSVAAGKHENSTTKHRAVEWLSRRYALPKAIAGVIAELSGLGGRA